MKERRYLYLGITLVLSACAILVFYDTFFHNGVLVVFFKKLLTVLLPVIYGFVIAYLLNPLMCAFERGFSALEKEMSPGVQRGVSILCTLCVAALALYAFFLLMLPELYASVEMLISNLSNYYEVILGWAKQLKEINPALFDKVGELLASYYENLIGMIYNDWLPRVEVAVMALTGGLVSVLMFFFDLFVGVCVSVYLLARKERFLSSSKRLLYSFLNRAHYDTVLKASRTANTLFSGYVRGQLIDALIIGGICFLFCTLFAMPYTPLVSMIVGVTNLIPFFGPFLGAIPSAFLILLVDPLKCLYFVIFIIILQQCDGNIIKPKLLGQRTGLSGFWVIFSILVGGGFFGPIGMLLGVPVFACIHAAVLALSERALEKKAAAEAAANNTPAESAEK